MLSKNFALALLVAYAEARFGQEQLPIAAISAVQGGAPGAAATIAGATVSDLLGGANACAKVVRADQIVTDLGGGADAIAAAIGLLNAEKNTNPFANNNVQNVCGDPTLPVTPELRGITTLIDPDVDNGSAATLAASTKTTPLDATGKSIFDLMVENGLQGLIASQVLGAAGGQAPAAAAGGNANAGNNNNNNNNNNQQQAGNNNGNQQQAGNGQQNNGNAGDADELECDDDQQQAGNGNQNAGQNNNNNQQQGQQNNNQQNQGQQNNNNQNQNQGQQNNNQQQGNAGNAANGAVDFGLCTPTIFRAGGLNGRPADEFTFQIEDPLARGGQGEALNPNIITNALCNQLTNVCEANAAAVALCEQGQAAVEAAGTRDDTTVTLFNGIVNGGGARRLVRSAKFRV